MLKDEFHGFRYTSLKGYVQELLLAHARTADADTYMERGYFYLLLHALLTDFRALSQEEESTGDMFYARRVIQYIHANYRSNLSLQEIAEQMYLSPSWVSRIFQKATGEHFASYIRKVRLDCARRALEESGFSVAQVAADSGFSTPSLFNRNFKAEYGLTPSEYREQHGVRLKQGDQGKASREKLIAILSNDQKLTISNIERPLSVHADVAQMRPWQKCASHVLNVGPAYVLSTAKIQKHVLRLADRLEVEYLRIWNPFSPELMICGEKEYNFTFIDEIMDFCVDNRLKLFIDLAQRKDMAMASESREIYSSENWTEFPCAAAWADALENFLLHIRRRYHERIVGQWIFELTFFLGDKPYS